MKRFFLISAIVLIVVLTLREVGFIRFSWFRTFADSNTSVETKVPSLNVSRFIYEQDTGRPYIPSIKAPDDFYKVTVRYRITASLSPWRWLPFFKFGSNTVQLTYFVWMEKSLAGCGSIYSTSKQTLLGVASARDYELSLTEPMIQKMKNELQPKVNIMKK